MHRLLPRAAFRTIALPIVMVVALTAAMCHDGRSGCYADPTGAACVAEYQATRAELPIPPVSQQTEVWCWAAVAEMIFRYYGLPNINPGGNYQCGVVAAYAYIDGGPSHPCVYDCTLCVSSIGTLTEMRRVVNGYGSVAQVAGFPSRVLSSQAAFSELPFQQLARDLDQGRPVIAGISFRGFRLPNISQHAVLIVGYDATVADPYVLVNDPYPYELVVPAHQNPYLVSGGHAVAPGRYRIPYRNFVVDLVWANTLHLIQ